MPTSSARKDLNLKGLELFRICARKGTLQAAAIESGLSVSTVSHHLRTLEDHLGVALFNHARRPMVLTPTGQVFLRNIDEALHAIRKAEAEASAGNLAEASYLRLGTLDDFDSDITPDLAVRLSNTMPRCNFLYHTESSHVIIEMLHNRKLDLAITSSPPDPLRDLQERPLLRDPFVLALPSTCTAPPDAVVQGATALPFLRFSDTLIIARQIEAHLVRVGIAPPRRFECTSHQTLMAMVAAGAGWTITTPLHFARARRFQPRVSLHRFPGKGFSRRLSVISTPDCAQSILDLVTTQVRALVTEHAIAPFHRMSPWLRDSFTLID